MASDYRSNADSVGGAAHAEVAAGTVSALPAALRAATEGGGYEEMLKTRPCDRRRGCRGKGSKQRHREKWLSRIGAAWADSSGAHHGHEQEHRGRNIQGGNMCVTEVPWVVGR